MCVVGLYYSVVLATMSGVLQLRFASLNISQHRVQSVSSHPGIATHRNTIAPNPVSLHWSIPHCTYDHFHEPSSCRVRLPRSTNTRFQRSFGKNTHYVQRETKENVHTGWPKTLTTSQYNFKKYRTPVTHYWLSHYYWQDLEVGTKLASLIIKNV